MYVVKNKRVKKNKNSVFDASFDNRTQKEPDLQTIIEAWPGLPERVKQTIKEIVKKYAGENEGLTTKTAYRKFKAEYKDCVLLFDMGDSYQAFYEDARICSKVLGLTLDSRTRADESIPIVRIPHHGVNGYVKKLVRAGYEVAVCERIGGRDVVKIITPEMLNETDG